MAGNNPRYIMMLFYEISSDKLFMTKNDSKIKNQGRIGFLIYFREFPKRVNKPKCYSSLNSVFIKEVSKT